MGSKDSKASKKTRERIKLDAFSVLACKEQALLPFLNVFDFKGIGPEEQRLGRIFGVIQVLDHDESSAYIPNLIAQVIKKEFFRNKKRSTERSFEAALHKANLTFADLARHEAIAWIGKLKAVVGVIAGKEFHFTQSGGGSILLIRDEKVTDISQGLDNQEGIGHPIKTFTNISSGKLKVNDKIIFTGEEFFQSFSIDDLNRHIKAFTSEEFDNLIKATLETEGENTGAIVINVQKESLSVAASPAKKKKKKDVNFFGLPKEVQKKEKVPTKSTSLKNESSSKVTAATAIEETLFSSSKTPQEKTVISHQEASPKATPSVKEKEAIAKDDHDEEDTSEIAPFEQEPEIFIKETEFKDEELEKEIKEHTQPLWREKLIKFRRYLKDNKNKLKTSFRSVISHVTSFFSLKPNFKESFSAGLNCGRNLIKKGSLRLSTIIKQIKSFLSSQLKKISSTSKIIPHKKAPFLKTVQTLSVSAKPASPLAWKAVWSNFVKQVHLAFNRIKRVFSEFRLSKSPLELISSKRFLLGTLIALLLIVFVSGLIIISQKKKHLSNIPSPTPTIPRQENTSRISSLQITTSFPEQIKDIVFLKNTFFLLSREKHFFSYNPSTGEFKKIKLPSGLRNAQSLAFMPPLQLVFLISPTAVYSYSPVTKKFSVNQIDLPAQLQVVSSDTFLTYIYLLDKNSNQIYQYPRATGGFGEKKSWLKEKISLENATDMAIDGSIYISFQDGQVKRFFRGKEKVSFNLGEQEIIPARLQVNHLEEDQPFFVLDSQQGRIVKISFDGKIEKEYIDPALQNAADFWVDFKNHKVFVLSKEKELLEFEIE